jgi:pimeloyl-ACP methyl ester carboxylesterase
LFSAAQALATQGHTTLRMDFRGRGDSSGSPKNVSLDGMIEDVVTAVSWLRAEHQVEHVNLVGLCSGGNVALGAASVLTMVDHVVCWSLLPFMEHKAQAAKQGTHRGQLLRQMLRKALQPENWQKLLRGEANVRGAAQAIAKDKEGDDVERQRKTSARDILRDLESFDGHLHLLYGSRDPESSGSQGFFENWCHSQHIPVDVSIIPGAPHNFYTAHWTRQVIEQTVSWLINEQ